MKRQALMAARPPDCPCRHSDVMDGTGLRRGARSGQMPGSKTMTARPAAQAHQQQAPAGRGAGAAPPFVNSYPPPGQARGGYPAGRPLRPALYRITPAWPKLGPIKPGAAHRHHSRRQGRHVAAPPLGAADPPHRGRSARSTSSFGHGMFVQAHGFCQDRDGNFWAGDSGPFADSPATKGPGFQLFKFAPRARCCCRSARPACRRPTRRRRSSVRRRARSRPTATSSWPTGTGRVRPTRSRTAIVWCGSRPTARSWPNTASWAPGPASSWARTRWRSTRRAACSWRDRSNNRVQIFDKDMKFVDEWPALRPAQRHHDPEGRHDDRGRLRSRASSSAGRRKRPRAAAACCATPAGATASAIGSAKDGSLRLLPAGHASEGMGADDAGNVFAGLTGNWTSASLAGVCRSGSRVSSSYRLGRATSIEVARPYSPTSG